jgi:hypothetical protein
MSAKDLFGAVPASTRRRKKSLTEQHRDRIIDSVNEIRGHLGSLEDTLQSLDDADGTLILHDGSIDSIELSLSDIEEFAADQAEVEARRRPLNRRQVTIYVGLLREAFQEVLDYDQASGVNERPPALWIDDERYLIDVRQLIQELQDLNVVLRSRKSNKEKISKISVSLSENAQKFLDNYIPILGKGVGCLTIAALAGLLIQLGVDVAIVDKILVAIRLAR